MCGENGTRDVTPTLDSANRKLKEASPKYSKIIIQTGVNDIENSSIHQVQQKIKQLIETAKIYHPKAQTFITSILPNNGENKSRDDINQYIQCLAEKTQICYIDTASKFTGRQSLYRDRKHPNRHGTAVLVSVLKDNLGLAWKNDQNHITYTRPYTSKPLPDSHKYAKQTSSTTKYSAEAYTSYQNRTQDAQKSAMEPKLMLSSSIAREPVTSVWNPTSRNPDKWRLSEMNINEQNAPKNEASGNASNCMQSYQYMGSTNDRKTNSPMWIQQNSYVPNLWYPPSNVMMRPPTPYWPPNMQIPPPRIY